MGTFERSKSDGIKLKITVIYLNWFRALWIFDFSKALGLFDVFSVSVDGICMHNAEKPFIFLLPLKCHSIQSYFFFFLLFVGSVLAFDVALPTNTYCYLSGCNFQKPEIQLFQQLFILLKFIWSALTVWSIHRTPKTKAYITHAFCRKVKSYGKMAMGRCQSKIS